MKRRIRVPLAVLVLVPGAIAALKAHSPHLLPEAPRPWLLGLPALQAGMHRHEKPGAPPAPRQYVARVDPGVQCAALPAPAAGTWKARDLFTATPGEALPPSMRDLCAIEWTPDATISPAAPALPPGATALMEDAPIVGTLSCSPTPPVSEGADRAPTPRALRQRFLEQVGFVQDLPGSLAKPTWIGIPDSSPDSDGCEIAAGDNPHGFNVAWIAHMLSCPRGEGQTCLSCTRTRSTLRGSGEAQGTGLFGTRGELAAAIHELVDSWRTAPDRAPSQRLVINLSVGWEPRDECAEVGKRSAVAQPLIDPPAMRSPRVACGADQVQLELPSDAVHRALMYASCHGALVIAAAGNDPGYDPPLRGAMRPAAWEASSRPTQEQCRALFADVLLPSFEAAASAYQPLVYAAGGVGYTDDPLPTTRQGGRPELAAPASLALAFLGPDAPPGSMAMSGTSAAAAVISGIAAAVWAYRPDLPAPDVVEIIKGSGEALYQDTADLCLGGDCGEIRRASLCAAINAACRGRSGVGACPETRGGGDTVPCAQRKAYADAPPAPRGATFRCSAGTCEQGQICVGGTCEAIEGVPYPYLPRSAAPVHGQPEVPACPDCTLFMDWGVQNVFDWRVAGQISERFFDETSADALEDTTLTLYSGRTALGSWALDPAEASGAAEVDGAGETSAEITYATLTWRQVVGTTRSVLTQEIPIVAR